MSSSMVVHKTFKFNNEISLKCCIVIDEQKMYWFKGKDIATFLDYSLPKKAIQEHVKSTNKKQLKDLISPNMCSLKNLQHQTIFITECGLYSLLMHSKMPLAKKFFDWIVNDVIPTLRKHQGTQQFIQNFNDYKYDECEKTMGYIYIASTPSYAERNIYKVGCTTHLDGRLNSLNTSNIESFKYYNVIAIDLEKNHITLEKLLHKMLENKCFIREFFELTTDDIYNVIPQFIKIMLLNC